MPINFPGPYQLKIFYTNTSMPHVQQINCNIVENLPEVGTPFGELHLVPRLGGAGPLLSVATLAWVDLLKVRFASTTNFTHAELWKFAAESFVGTYVSAMSIGVAGTSVGAQKDASQDIFTFITEEGNLAQIQLMESVSVVSPARDPYPFQAQSLNDIAEYVADSTTWFLGRDTSFIRVPRNYLPGINEALFKKRYRDT